MTDVNSSIGCVPDNELVISAQANDEAAFAELVRRTSPASLRLAISILRDRQEAEDELQNSYLKAWRHISQFQREARFSTWISRIVTNQCLMRLRRLRGRTYIYLDDPAADEGSRPREVIDKGANPEMNLGSKEISELLKTEISRLPPILRNVLILRDVEELSSAEVADRLSISTPAVKSRLLRARIELRTRLEKHSGRAGAATLTA